MGWEEKVTLSGQEFYFNTDTEQVSWQKPEELMTPEEKEDNSHTWVWVPHENLLWQPAKRLETTPAGDVMVELENGEHMMVPKSGVMKNKYTKHKKQIVPLWEVKKRDLRFLEDDCVMLDPVNEAFIIYNLEMRYKEQSIYTCKYSAPNNQQTNLPQGE